MWVQLGPGREQHLEELRHGSQPHKPPCRVFLVELALLQQLRHELTTLQLGATACSSPC